MCVDKPDTLKPESGSEAFFQKLNIIFFGCFDPIFFFLIIKINNFRGDLSDISAKRQHWSRVFTIFGLDFTDPCLSSEIALLRTGISAFLLAEISVRSPRNLFIFII